VHGAEHRSSLSSGDRPAVSGVADDPGTGRDRERRSFKPRAPRQRRESTGDDGIGLRFGPCRSRVALDKEVGLGRRREQHSVGMPARAPPRRTKPLKASKLFCLCKFSPPNFPLFARAVWRSGKKIIFFSIDDASSAVDPCVPKGAGLRRCRSCAQARSRGQPSGSRCLWQQTTPYPRLLRPRQRSPRHRYRSIRIADDINRRRPPSPLRSLLRRTKCCIS